MSGHLTTVEVTGCSLEPIHIPGSIQPHGILLTIAPATSKILQVGGDAARIAGREVERMLGNTVEQVLGTGSALLIQSIQGSPEPVYLGSFAAPGDPGRLLDLTAHDRDGVFVLELEPGSPDPSTGAVILTQMRRTIAGFQSAPDLIRVLEAAAREARQLTGFDRVMIYRFLDDGAGSVVAEAKIESLQPFLNHHYPASDIPEQARALYLRNPIRVIPDVNFEPAPLVPALNPVTGKPLDMSQCSLRSVSPIHIQYLKNMGVMASMSVSIVVNHALWGLIAFHHHVPKRVSYELREVSKHLGQILSQQISAREEAKHHQQIQHLGAVREEIVGVLARAHSFVVALHEGIGEIRSVVPANGAAILAAGTVSKIGHTPTDAHIRELGGWLLGSVPSEVYQTNSLAGQYAPASAYATEASGLLATVVSRDEPLVLFWFRAERLETINWAGNPHKPAEQGMDGVTLTPRKSFDSWKETVRQQSAPWSSAEVDAARRFGRAMFGLRQQQTVRELNAQLRRTLTDKETLLAQKDLLMQEVNHRVQNSLQFVNSMLHMQARDTGDAQVKAHFEEASRRVLAVSTVHRRLWRSDHIHSVDFGIYLEELRDGLVETWGNDWAGHIKINSYHVRIPTNTAVVLALVITELLTNAVKYAYRGEPGPIDVKCTEIPGSIRILVTDQGVGLSQGAPPGGLGARLTTSLIAQLKGELNVVTGETGTSITFTVPLTPPPTAA